MVGDASGHDGLDSSDVGQHDRRLPDDGHRCLFATTDAGCRDDAHIGPEDIRQACQQALCAAQLTGKAIANPHRQLRRFLPVAQHLEVVVERGDFKDLCHGHVHLTAQRHQVAIVQAAVAVVQPVQVLDEQVAAMGAWSDQCLDLCQGRLVGLPALELALLAEFPADLVDRGDGHDGGFRFGCLGAHGTSLRGKGGARRALGREPYFIDNIMRFAEQ